MTGNGLLQIGVYLGLLLLLVRPFGGYMQRVYAGERSLLDPLLRPIEKLIYRLAGIDPKEDQHWTAYTAALLLFNLAGVVFLFVLQLVQHRLPLNPQNLGPVRWDLALNTAVSFVTNTNWQAYTPEITMSYLVQMAGLTVQNFLSAATGMAAALVFIRAFSRHAATGVGNFWVDLVRSTLWILLPLSLLMALALVWQGVPQNFQPYAAVATMEGGQQTLPQGPVASQESIKILGTNGGGFFNANSAHPYENPTPLTNFLQVLAIFVIGAGLTNTFGRMVKDERQGWALLSAMMVLFLAGVFVIYWAESSVHPALQSSELLSIRGDAQPGGNMEGKEIRFGQAGSALFATATTDASCGAVNSVHDSYMPLSVLALMVNIMLGEIIVGGVGSGLYGMLLFALMAVFIAGLMVGRTPEYLGKKIEAREMKMTMIAIVLVPPLSILGLAALASVHPLGRLGPFNAGPRAFSEILYAYTSGAGNNGSALAGINSNTVFYNLTMALAMLAGRFLVLVPALAAAGSLVRKKIVPASSGTFPTTGVLFVGLLVGVILIVGGLIYFPALSLGPVVEHLLLRAGRLF